ncbi:Uncharacterized NAD(P)/FAD-binding protein YdhS [Devosia enhydra]|uniref:Uncharacterized NAD(P)/FAD-binding protein YdhS n=1 Tax=Devosia enhydra TaxID=665118 RepID=A0A1K2HXX0_9HYPH|nr:FAD/NAD(P)-binding protein [Devosia enhydra]SFZ84574.1 Uncharacterized NAD(P)/FAD-binding protein YdhS [Devosia enhydra]
MTAALSVIIVGGGASGVTLAAQLLEDVTRPIRVTLVERRDRVGEGVAYSARQREHVLNVPAQGMSAFPDRPEHFFDWLVERGLIGPSERFTFVPRRLYGQYLWSLVAPALAANDGRLTLAKASAVDLVTSGRGVEVALDNGTSLVGQVAVICVGHEEKPPRANGVAVRVGSDADTDLDPEAEVVILGSGLSMVDAWLRLDHSGHRGPVTVLSRRGLLPQAHRQVTPIPLEAADVPFGTDTGYFTRWFRALCIEVEQRGGDWRSVVDALRPFNQRIWQGWTVEARRRFLRHVRPFWNIHRHRIPPDIHARLGAAVETGRIRLLAAEFIGVEAVGTRARMQYRPKGETRTLSRDIDRIYDCGGVSVDVTQSSNPLVTALIARGSARPDALRIGMDVTPDLAVVDRDGVASARVFALGPLTRGTFFEIEAMPDIRVQASLLAERLKCRSDAP